MSTKNYYYVSANTAEGFINFLPSNIEELNKVIVLNHPSHNLKTEIIKGVIKAMETNQKMEVLCSSLGSKYIDGISLPDKSLAIISNTISELEYDHIININLDELFNEKKVLTFGDDYDYLINKRQQSLQDAYKNFATGLKIHDDLEAIYINEMDFNRADEVAEEFIDKLLYGLPKKGALGKVYHRLFGTNTVDGVVNVVPQILNDLSNNYFIKGRAGTGKSTFMKKILRACTNHGLDVELYHCSFDPTSIDMVLVRELDFCIFDSTDPHEFFPERDGDEIIDLYEELVTPGTDEKFESEITELNNRYKSYMKKGIENLKVAGEYLEDIEQKYNFTDEEVAITVRELMKLTK